MELVIIGLMIGGIGQSRAAAGEIYWTDDDVIRHANLNGTGEVILLTGLAQPESIAVDSAGGKMYWLEGESPIKRANLHGMGVETVVVGLISNQTQERVASHRRGSESNHDTTEAQ